ncbi:DUF4440 domain-containing protein [Streptomyces sp. SM11]|uniref:DUF4440 domain-containing protein n=1 Tax=Streptomyces sp. SM11 TaxID=565557 RepID=UPI000CD5594F|nr:DUF4440 domain-containing protein [Streptomyces sp. SM11]
MGSAIDGKLRLLDPAVRLSRPITETLLGPQSVEAGASGRRWTYEETLAALAALPRLGGGDADGPRYERSGMTGADRVPGLVHLTYETVIGGNRARRSSLWRRQPDGTAWRMYYHQATPVPAG